MTDISYDKYDGVFNFGEFDFAKFDTIISAPPSLPGIQYSNMLDYAHTTIVDMLTTNAIIADYTTNILDGIPTNLYRGVGFPYIVVNTPTVSDDRYTQTQIRSMLTFTIEIYDKKENNVREIADAIKNCLYSEQAQLREKRLTHMVIKNTRLEKEYLLDEGSTPVWRYMISPVFRWVGS